MPPLYIFDVDGTVALIDHRRHLLEGDDPDKWRKFYAACDKDLPNTPVIETLERLWESGADIWFFSGRSSEVRGKTVDWLSEHTSFACQSQHYMDTTLVMRELGDTTADDDLKRSWYEGMLDIDKERLVAVFDDRKRVVDMWRSLGVTCFQVAPGEF